MSVLKKFGLRVRQLREARGLSQEDFAEAAEKAFDSMPRAKRKDDATVEEVMRTAIRREADAIWGKKPVCKVIVHRL